MSLPLPLPIPRVLSVSAHPSHTFTKPPLPSIFLVINHGVQGDCHAGATVQHRSRLKIRPAPPNLRQVHLMPVEILDEVCEEGQGDEDEGEEGKEKGKGKVLPGELGENITTVGIDLLGLGEGTVLRFVDDDDVHPHPRHEAGNTDSDNNDNDNDEENPSVTAPVAPPPPTASVRITGLRNPCPQIEKFKKGLQERFIVRDEARKIVARKAGVMGVVESSGEVRPGMRIVAVENENGKRGDGFRPLGCV